MGRSKKSVFNGQVEKLDTATVLRKLANAQRQRSVVIKSRIMQENRIVAVVAGTMGYDAFDDEKKREEAFEAARKEIKAILEKRSDHPYAETVWATYEGINAFNAMKDRSTKEIEGLVKDLPIREWIDHPDQKGFGHLSCGMILGEVGDLANYANPGKLWKRMGCAPYTSERLNKTLMGGTWKRGMEGKLSAEEWTEFGYSPRRRSIMYVITECLLKANGEGPYRERYIEAKIAAYYNHKDDPKWVWKKCDGCKGKADGCTRCGDTGVKCGRAHLHGMLLAGKLLLKNLWKVWNPHLVREETPELWQASKGQVKPELSLKPTETKPTRKRKAKEEVQSVANRSLYS